MNYFALLPLLYLVPLKRGDDVTVVSRLEFGHERGTSLLDITLRSISPDEPVRPADVIIAVGDESVATLLARRSLLPAKTHSIILLKPRESIWSGFDTVARRFFGVPRSTLGGRRAAWDLLIEPDIRNPKFLVRTGFQSPIPVCTSVAWRQRIKKLGAFYLLTRDSAQVYSKDPLGAPVCRAFSESSDFQRGGTEGVRDIRVSNAHTLIINKKSATGMVYVRFPLSTEALERVTRHHELTGEVREAGFALAPKPLSRDFDDLTPFVVEEGLPGRPGGEGSSENQRSEALDAVTKLHERTVKHRGPLTETRFDRFVEPRLAIIEERLGARPVRPVRRFLQQHLIGSTVLIAACHGDYKLENCLFAGSTITGVLDWDLGSRNDLAILDVANLHATRAPRSSLSQMARNTDLLGTSYLNYIKRTGVDRIDPDVLLCLWQVDRIAKQCRYAEASEDWLFIHAELRLPPQGSR